MLTVIMLTLCNLTICQQCDSKRLCNNNFQMDYLGSLLSAVNKANYFPCLNNTHVVCSIVEARGLTFIIKEFKSDGPARTPIMGTEL